MQFPKFPPFPSPSGEVNGEEELTKWQGPVAGLWEWNGESEAMSSLQYTQAHVEVKASGGAVILVTLKQTRLCLGSAWWALWYFGDMCL